MPGPGPARQPWSAPERPHPPQPPPIAPPGSAARGPSSWAGTGSPRCRAAPLVSRGGCPRLGRAPAPHHAPPSMLPFSPGNPEHATPSMHYATPSMLHFSSGKSQHGSSPAGRAQKSTLAAREEAPSTNGGGPASYEQPCPRIPVTLSMCCCIAVAVSQPAPCFTVAPCVQAGALLAMAYPRRVRLGAEGGLLAWQAARPGRIHAPSPIPLRLQLSPPLLDGAALLQMGSPRHLRGVAPVQVDGGGGKEGRAGALAEPIRLTPRL